MQVLNKDLDMLELSDSQIFRNTVSKLLIRTKANYAVPVIHFRKVKALNVTQSPAEVRKFLHS